MPLPDLSTWSFWTPDRVGRGETRKGDSPNLRSTSAPPGDRRSDANEQSYAVEHEAAVPGHFEADEPKEKSNMFETGRYKTTIRDATPSEVSSTKNNCELFRKLRKE